MKKTIALTLFSLMALASTAEAANYYVSASTTSVGDGSKAAPFQTLNDAFDGTPTLVDGDEVRVETGTYSLSNHITFSDLASAMTGVTLRGGYKGFETATGLFNDTSASAMARPVTVNVGIYSFNLYDKSVVDGLKIRGQTSSQNIFYFNDAGAAVRNSDIDVNEGVFYVNADAARIEDNIVMQRSCSDLISVQSSQAVLVQRNSLTKTSCNRVLYMNTNSRAVFRLNTVSALSGSVANGYGYLLAYQNFLTGNPQDHSDTAFYPRSSDHWWVVFNNNISHFYWAFDAERQENYYALNASADYNRTRYFAFDNNLVFNNGYDYDGSFYHEDYPYSNFFARGNCMDTGAGTSFGYLYSYEGFYGYPKSVKELEELAPENFAGNIALTTPLANPKGTACGGKGVSSGLISAKPIARPYAYDGTGNTATSDIAVHPGEPFTLDGDLSINFEAGSLTYQWSQLSGPVSNVLNAADLAAEEVTGYTNTPGVYKFQLRVRSPEGDNVLSDAATVTVWVMPKVTLTSSTGALRGQFKYLQQAVFNAQPGDTITLPAGMFIVNEYDDGSNTYDSVEIYGKSDLTIQGQGHGPTGTIIGNREWNDLFDVEYSRNITFRNLEFMDIGNDGYYMVYAYGVSNLVLDNVLQDGAKIDTDEGYTLNTQYASVTVRNSTFRYLYEPLYFQYSGQFDIHDNTFVGGDDYNVYVYTYYGENNWVKVRNNRFDQKTAGDEVIYIDDMYGSTGFDNSGIGTLIEGNTIRNPYGEGIYLDDIYGAGALVKDNVIYTDRRWTDNGDYGIYIYNGAITLRNNVIYNPYYDGVYNSSGVIYLEGNVIAGSEDYGINNNNYDCYYECTYYATAKNNILYNNEDGPYYYVRVLEGNSFADPMFVNPDVGNFTPAAGSPLLSMPGMGIYPVSPAPGGLAGVALVGGARITFDAVEGSTGYKLYWGESAGVYAQSQDLGAEQVVDIDGLAAMPYYFAVAARNANGEGSKSQAIIVIPEAAPEAVSAQSSPSVDGVFPHKLVYKQVVDLEISGADFKDGAKVYIGSTEIEVTEISDTMIKAKTTTDVKYGVHPIIVVNTDLGRGALPQGLIVSRVGDDEAGGCASGGNSGNGFALVLAVCFAALLLRRRVQ